MKEWKPMENIKPATLIKRFVFFIDFKLMFMMSGIINNSRTMKCFLIDVDLIFPTQSQAGRVKKTSTKITKNVVIHQFQLPSEGNLMIKSSPTISQPALRDFRRQFFVVGYFSQKKSMSMQQVDHSNTSNKNKPTDYATSIIIQFFVCTTFLFRLIFTLCI